MKENCFTTLMQELLQGVQPALRIQHPAAGGATFALLHQPGGEVSSRFVIHPSVANLNDDLELVGYLHFLSGDGDRDDQCVFVARHSQVVVNGLSPPLPAMTLEPGTLLSFRGEFLHYAVQWTPEVAEPPEHLREKPCPVCGCPLEAAPVVQCLCGRWTHLQNPDMPDDPEALNCFLHAKQCQCQRKSSLTPLVEPELPQSLGAIASWDEW